MKLLCLSSLTCGLLGWGLVGVVPAEAVGVRGGPLEAIVAPVLAQIAWQTLASDAGRFSVALPTASPQFNQQTTYVLDQPLNWEITQTQTEVGFYAIAYTDLPLALLAAGQTAVLETVQSQLLAQDFDWRTLVGNSHEVPLGENLSGREFTTVYQDTFSSLRVYLVKRRLYLLFAVADDIADSAHFLDSFTVDDIWNRYESAAGNFAISVPLTPIATTEATPVGETTLTWQKVVARNLYDIEDRFAVAYTDLPDEPATATFGTVTTAVVNNLDGVTLTPTDAPRPFGDYPNQEFIGVTAIGQPVILRFYQVDNRIYAIFARSFSATRLDRFINSFTLTP